MRCKGFWTLKVMERCASLMLSVVLLGVIETASAAEGPVVVSSPPDLLPRAALIASDNSVEVAAAPVSMGYRGPVLFFAGQFRRDFLRVTQLEAGRVEFPITICLGSRTNDSRVMGSFASGAAGVTRESIEVPDPEHADLDLLRTALAQAMVREWQRTLPAAPGAKPPQGAPPWLLAGLARHLGGEHRLDDLDLVHAQWQRGRLPPLKDLLANPAPVALQYPALQAVMAAWLLDHPGDWFSVLLRRLAEGISWSPALVAEALHAPRGVAGLGEEWDAWQVNAMREIRQVGVTTPGMVRAFRAQLLFYPGDCGLPAAEAWRGRAFSECLSWPQTPEWKDAVGSKAAAIRNFAAGRDGAMQRVAQAYVTFLEALAAGETPAQLRTLLAKAEEARRVLEERVGKGEVLHEPVAGGGAVPLQRK